ncbi:sensor domain-containing diguanylate cyclase [Enterovibrio calviensis]|uniref:sensor domain-containing diguanylate cyclase n=1 Tax=Enterovibrio calviensis TaxID=91359 RepID=UPI000AC8C82F|nr:GGDEF domain-containing protein [Enterovibrio calviensis]
MSMSESEKVIRRIYEITNDYEKGLDYQIDALIRMGLERFNLDIGILSIIDGDHYEIRHVVCPDDIPIKQGDSFPYDMSYCWVTLEADGPIAMEQVGKTDVLGNHPAYQAFGLESYIGIPIRVNNKVQGTLNFTSPNPYPREFKEIDLDSLCLMATWLEVEYARRLQQDELEKLNARLEELVRTDPLTGLSNRRHMFDQIDASINIIRRKKLNGAVMLLDLDHFKRVNDQFGHQKGDEVLVAVSDALKSALRNYDCVGRYGGEEFIIWLEDVELSQVNTVCKRIRKSLSKLSIDSLKVTCSIGVHYFTHDEVIPFDKESVINRLIKKADSALFESKNSGRDRVTFFDDSAKMTIS